MPLNANSAQSPITIAFKWHNLIFSCFIITNTKLCLISRDAKPSFIESSTLLIYLCKLLFSSFGGFGFWWTLFLCGFLFVLAFCLFAVLWFLKLFCLLKHVYTLNQFLLCLYILTRFFSSSQLHTSILLLEEHTTDVITAYFSLKLTEIGSMHSQWS